MKTMSVCLRLHPVGSAFVCVCVCVCVHSRAGTAEVVERVKSCCRSPSTGIKSQGRKEGGMDGWIDIFIEDR